LAERSKGLADHERSKKFLKLFFAIHDKYEKGNAQKQKIDFEDMISKSSERIASKRFKSRFKYILVDEFQDMSAGRANLLTALRKLSEDSRLFCVGDDWQSIFRFTGSDIGIMTNFHEVFGFTKRIDLDRTFRFNDKIEALSSRFILKNPTQLKKQLTPNTKIQEPAVFIQLCNPGSEDECLEMIMAELDQEVKSKKSLFVLGRYNRKLPSEDKQLHFKKQFSKIEVTCLTAHKSKGLEADYVIVNHLVRGTFGFPSEISDDPLLELVLSNPDKHEYGEERRLFYVAVSRAKEKVFLISENLNRSSFIQELIDDKSYEVIVRGVSEQELLVKCPDCGGTMEARNQRSSENIFFSCSNYPWCNYAENACPKCKKGIFTIGKNLTIRCSECDYEGRLCPKCKKGTMENRTGKYGPFLGCSMYKSSKNHCTYTENLDIEEHNSPYSAT